MMHFVIDTVTPETVNIEVYPQEIRSNPSDTTITFGDMHANTMKLLWCLICEGVIKMDEEKFDEMWEAYRDNDVEGFVALISNIEVINPDLKVRLLGDVFSDRGQNDYFTLKVLEKLHQDSVKPEIVYSNHDVWLFGAYKKPTTNWEIIDLYNMPFAGYQSKSGAALKKLIDSAGYPDPASVQDLIDKYVFPSIKLISYSLSADEKEISLFTHAPNNFGRIKELAEALEVEWPKDGPKSALELAGLAFGSEPVLESELARGVAVYQY